MIQATIKGKLQVLSFMFTSNFRRCPLAQKLTGGVGSFSDPNESIRRVFH
ncbi:hypothetical protein Hanom_Chr04g00329501 [Helianthus anomalus]